MVCRVRADLKLAKRVLEGEEKATNAIREIFKSVQRDKVPQSWRKYVVEDMSMPLWVDDLAHRVEFLGKVVSSGAGKYGRTPMWLGGLSTPEAFVAATRQAVSQGHDWSLEQLRLEVTVQGDSNAAKPGPDTFTIEGMNLLGACWSQSALAFSNDESFPMPPMLFTWKLIDPKEKDSSAGFASVPVYLNSNRLQFLFSVRLKCPTSLPPNVWNQRGTCLIAWHAQV